MAKNKLRLSPFVSVIPVGEGFNVRSDLRSFALSGSDLTEFVGRALPLLNGENDAESIVSALAEFDRNSVFDVLADWERIGVVEHVDESDSNRQPEEAATIASFRYWAPDPTVADEGVHNAHVAVLGLNDQTLLACKELVRAGIGRLTVFELLGIGSTRSEGIEPAGSFLNELRELHSRTVISARPVSLHNSELEGTFADVSLMLATIDGDELMLLDAIARTAQRWKFRYLVAHFDGLNALLGPVVIPGETACWECLRRRVLANHTSVVEATQLHTALLAGASPKRKSLALPGASSTLGGLIALEVIRLLSAYTQSQLVGRQLEINLVTYEARFHTIIRLPWCPVCGGAAEIGNRPQANEETTSNGHPPTDLAASPDTGALRDALAGWVDARTGIVRHMVLNDLTPDQPQTVFTATALISGAAVPGHPASEPLIGSGKSTTKVGAMTGAVGEAIERYSASIYRETDLTRASPHKLGSDCFDPRALTLYLPQQYRDPRFPYDAFDTTREISWTEGMWLDSGAKVLVPALPTFFNYHAPRHEHFCQVTSNGLATGSSFEDAALRATLELIERDAFMMTWLQRRPPQLLSLGTDFRDDASEVIEEFDELGMDVKLYLLNSDVRICSVMCLAFGDGKTRPAVTVALAAHFDPVEAVRKAILEQAHVGPYITRLMSDASQVIPRTACDVSTLNDHALFYASRRRLAAFDFIRMSSNNPLPLGKIRRSELSGIDTCIAALADGGFRVAVADVTAPDVRSGPFRVARALGTHLQPIDFGHRQRRLANPRLWDNRGRVTQYPHPLA